MASLPGPEGEDHQEAAGDKDVREEHDHLRLIGEGVVEDNGGEDAERRASAGRDAGLEAVDDMPGFPADAVAAGTDRFKRVLKA